MQLPRGLGSIQVAQTLPMGSQPQILGPCDKMAYT